ncbi:MAG: hypothetical protein ACLR43_09825 [Faecalibacillus faecis]
MMNPEQPDNTKPAQPTDTKKDSQSTNKVETTNQKTTSVKLEMKLMLLSLFHYQWCLVDYS